MTSVSYTSSNGVITTNRSCDDFHCSGDLNVSAIKATSATNAGLHVQGSVSIGAYAAPVTTVAEAALTVDSNAGTLGIMLPHFTDAQLTAAAATPANYAAGMLVYNSTTNKLNIFNGTAFTAVASA